MKGYYTQPMTNIPKPMLCSKAPYLGSPESESGEDLGVFDGPLDGLLQLHLHLRESSDRGPFRALAGFDGAEPAGSPLGRGDGADQALDGRWMNTTGTPFYDLGN